MTVPGFDPADPFHVLLREALDWRERGMGEHFPLSAAAESALEALRRRADGGPGQLLVGSSGIGEVLVELDRDRTGHIRFTPEQARDLARLLGNAAESAEWEAGHCAVCGEDEHLGPAQHPELLQVFRVLEAQTERSLTCKAHPSCMQAARELADETAGAAGGAN